jgi:hypothetical protein
MRRIMSSRFGVVSYFGGSAMKRYILLTRSIYLLSSFLVMTLGFISACALAHTLPANPSISRDKAIELATDGCKIPHLVLEGDPQNIRLALMTLHEADQLIRVAGESINYGIPMDMKVWLVQMDGNLLLVGGPVPVSTPGGPVITPTPPQPFWGTCSAIINADSGALISISDLPSTPVPHPTRIR